MMSVIGNGPFLIFHFSFSFSHVTTDGTNENQLDEFSVRANENTKTKEHIPKTADLPDLAPTTGLSLMRLFHGTDNAEIQRPTVLTLGVFDGLHLGHQLIMRTVVERARETGAVPTVITFDPHPRAVLHPESAPPLLQTLDQKVEGFGVLGIEQTIVIRFHEGILQRFELKIFCAAW